MGPTMYQQYLRCAIELLDQLEKTQGEVIRQAAEIVAEAVARGRLVYTFGSGHSQLTARDVAYRAGGLVPLVHLPDPAWGLFERIEGSGCTLISQYPIQAGDVLFVISNSGRNPEPVEVAMVAGEKGLKVIAILSMQHARGVSSCHSSGKKLYQVADVVLDTGAPSGDAAVAIPGLPEKVGPVSTLLGAALLQAVMVEAVQILVEQGITPPILISANIDGSDEHNRALFERFPELRWLPKFSF